MTLPDPFLTSSDYRFKLITKSNFLVACKDNVIYQVKILAKVIVTDHDQSKPVKACYKKVCYLVKPIRAMRKIESITNKS